MIDLLVVVVSAAVFVAAVTKILDLPLRQAEGPSHPLPASEPPGDEEGAVDEIAVEQGVVEDDSSAAVIDGPAMEEDAEEPGAAHEPVAEETPQDAFIAEALPEAGPLSDLPEQVDEDPAADERRSRSRLGASSRLLVTVIAIGAAVSLAVVLLVGWLARLIATALS